MKATQLIAVLAALAVSGTVFAQDNNNQETIDDSGIAPQALDTALEEFAERSGLQVIYLADVAKGKQSPGAEPDLSDQATLDQLLASTDVEYEFLNDNTVTLQATDERGASDSKNLTPTPVLMAQNQTTPTQTTSSRSEESGTAIVTGKVTDARTGANLKGAKVTIEETGQWTSTNDLGEFRFVNVPTGSATLTVSYLGYAGQSAEIGARGDGTTQNFALRGGSEIEEIVVFGQRSARALALNQERTAENSTTILSSDLLGQFPGATLAETLRRAPGVSFQEDPITGDGTKVAIRGLAPDLNQIRLDGQRLPEGSGTGRTAAIGNLLTESIDKVVISKTLLPNQDTAGTGGLIEIETKGPLDRAEQYYAFMAQVEPDNDFASSTQLGATLARTFGTERPFGVSLSLQSREESNDTVSYTNTIEAFGQYLPLSAEGNPITSIEAIGPVVAFPFEIGVDEVYPREVTSGYSAIENDTYSLNLVAQWRPTPGTNWRINYGLSKQDTTNVNRSPTFGALSLYDVLPIEELGDEPRGAYVWQGNFDSNLPVFTEHTVSEGVSDNDTETLSFEGNTVVGQWEFEYRLSESNAETTGTTTSGRFRLGSDSFSFDLSEDFLLGAITTNTVDGRVVSPFVPMSGTSIQLPMLTAAGFETLNSPSSYFITSGSPFVRNTSIGSNERESAALDVKRTFRSEWLDYIQLGIEVERSRFDDGDGRRLSYRVLDSAVPLSDLGVDRFGANNLSSIGVDAGFNTLLPSDFGLLFSSIVSNSRGEDARFSEAVTEAGVDDTYTEEIEFAPYIQARLEFGSLEIIGGIRYSQVDVTARIDITPFTYVDGFDPERDARLKTIADAEATVESWLPRVALNYRPVDDVVVRAGYFESIARPEIRSLADESRISLFLIPFFGPNRDQPILSVFKGNPSLEPALTRNYDLSVAWYDDNAGVLQASVFYKEIENFFEFSTQSTSTSLDGVLLPDDEIFNNLPDNLFVQVTQPLNNDRPADVFGFELVYEKQFTSLPGAWSGLGLFGNYTYSDSEKYFVFEDVLNPDTGEFVDVEVSGVPFDQSPKHSGTIGVTYNKHALDASISYTSQSERLDRYRGNGLVQYVDGDDSLDATLEYRLSRLGGDWILFAAGLDLLKGKSEPQLHTYLGGDGGVPQIYTSGSYSGGRSFVIGVRAAF